MPGWAKDPAIGSRLINARAETAAEKPAFRTALRQRRCLVVADGFYEWQQAGRTKQPYFIHLRDDRPFALAGLWEAWEGADHARLETCTLLTTGPNDVVRPIHDRMPVILPPQAYSSWLDPAIQDPRQLAPLLVPYPSDQMEAYRVGSLVNSPSHDAPGCIEPTEGAFREPCCGNTVPPCPRLPGHVARILPHKRGHRTGSKRLSTAARRFASRRNLR